MSTYKGWAIKLANGTFMDDSNGDIQCALFPTRREAQAFKNSLFLAECKVVKVTVTVSEAK